MKRHNCLLCGSTLTLNAKKHQRICYTCKDYVECEPWNGNAFRVYVLRTTKYTCTQAKYEYNAPYSIYPSNFVDNYKAWRNNTTDTNRLINVYDIDIRSLLTKSAHDQETTIENWMMLQ